MSVVLTSDAILYEYLTSCAKMLAINPWMFSKDVMTLIGSEFSEPSNVHSDVHDLR